VDYWDPESKSSGEMEAFLWERDSQVHTMHYLLQKSDIDIRKDSREKTEWLKYRNEGQPLLNEDLLLLVEVPEIQTLFTGNVKPYCWNQAHIPMIDMIAMPIDTPIKDITPKLE